MMRWSGLCRLAGRILAIGVMWTPMGGICCAQTVGSAVLPREAYAQDGNASSSSPLNITPALQNQRLQQVYGAVDLPRVPILIQEIAFRPDASTGLAFSSTLGNVQINLSTTAKSVNELSLEFGRNVGLNDTVVHSGPLALASAAVPGWGNSRQFDVVVPLQQPFVYDPSEGNLLIDFRNFAGGTTTPLDAAAIPFDSVSRAYISNSIDSPFASGADTWSLVTKLTFEPLVREYRYEFTGVVDYVEDSPGWLGHTIELSTPVTGSFNLFERGHVLAPGIDDQGNITSKIYLFGSGVDGGGPLQLPYEMSVQIGDHVFRSSFVKTGNPLLQGLWLDDNAPDVGDAYRLQAPMALSAELPPGLFGGLSLNLVDSSGDSFGPLSLTDADSIPLPGIGRWDAMTGGISLQDATFERSSGVRFRLTSLRLVPEPTFCSAELLLMVGMWGLRRSWRRKGPSTSVAATAKQRCDCGHANAMV